MNRLLLKTGLFATLMLMLSLSFNSCNPEQPTLVNINITDTSGSVIENAMVRLYPEPTLASHNAIIIDDTAFTDFEGNVTFDYTDEFNLGQAGFAVLDIEVLVSRLDGEDSLVGEGIVKIQSQEVNEQDIIAVPAQ